MSKRVFLPFLNCSNERRYNDNGFLKEMKLINKLRDYFPLATLVLNFFGVLGLPYLCVSNVD